jgi:UDP-3-O-[3-hydroxymyristoyl] glucosamine N-acyltransferase
MAGIPIAARPIQDLVERHGGALRNGAHGVVRRLAPIASAGAGELAPLLAARYVEDAAGALARGAFLLIDEALAVREDVATLPGWFHPHAAWALAEVLDTADAPADEAVAGDGCRIASGAVLMPRVRLGKRVTVEPGAVIGAQGFGWATGPGGRVRAIPQLGGVVIEDDVHVGALTTIASGTLSPTIIRRGAKLDAQVHVAHNCEVGEGTIIAAQSGMAGSVTIGSGVLVGGQVGIADHLRVGDGARIAAKSGVIGDVAAGSTVAGYPAVERHRWLRGLAELYRLASQRVSSTPPSSGRMRASTLPPAPKAPEINPAAVIRRTDPPPPPSGAKR